MTKVDRIRNDAGETIVAVYNKSGFLFRIWETEDINVNTASINLSYDEVERMRDTMSQYLIENWPQDD